MPAVRRDFVRFVEKRLTEANSSPSLPPSLPLILGVLCTVVFTTTLFSLCSDISSFWRSLTCVTTIPAVTSLLDYPPLRFNAWWWFSSYCHTHIDCRLHHSQSCMACGVPRPLLMFTSRVMVLYCYWLEGMSVCHLLVWLFLMPKLQPFKGTITAIIQRLQLCPLKPRFMLHLV